jgi:hypothetical protein
MVIHVKTTEKNVSLTEYSVTFFLVKTKPEIPEKKVTMKDLNNENIVVSLKCQATGIQVNINKLSNIRLIEIM